MPALDEALFQINRDEIVELAKRLIRVPSVTGEEKRVILLARLGWRHGYTAPLTIDVTGVLGILGVRQVKQWTEAESTNNTVDVVFTGESKQLPRRRIRHRLHGSDNTAGHLHRHIDGPVHRNHRVEKVLRVTSIAAG